MFELSLNLAHENTEAFKLSKHDLQPKVFLPDRFLIQGMNDR